MIAFWRSVFAHWDSAVPARRGARVRDRGHGPFPGAVLIGWALGLVMVFVLAGLPTPGAAQTYTCPATSAAADALCGGNPEFQGCLIDVSAPDAGTGAIVTEQRHYCIHVPEVFAAQSLPVVFGFHGGGGDGGRMVNIWEKHTQQGMVLVFPTALPTTRSSPVATCLRVWRTLNDEHPDWSDFGDLDPCPHPLTGNQTPYGHDLAMVETIAQDIIDQDITPQGFYAAGFSSGAAMVHQLFVTRRSALAFDGFAATGIGIDDAKTDAVGAAGFGPYQPNTDVRRPIILTTGTSDKSFPNWDNFVDGVNSLAGTVPTCPATMSTVEEFVACYRVNETLPGLGLHTMLNTMEITRDWFVAHNAAGGPAVEGLYPNLGHGSAFTGHEDTTLAVREDYRADPAVADSAAVAAITVVYGRHNWPGNNGNAPPCAYGNCDIDLTEEVLQFWRANAGFESEWP